MNSKDIKKALSRFYKNNRDVTHVLTAGFLAEFIKGSQEFFDMIKAASNSQLLSWSFYLPIIAGFIAVSIRSFFEMIPQVLTFIYTKMKSSDETKNSGE